jgi:hypothetical protein
MAEADRRENGTKCKGDVGGDAKKSLVLEHLVNIYVIVTSPKCSLCVVLRPIKGYIAKCFRFRFLASLKKSLD